jgi:hypothetical protein
MNIATGRKRIMEPISTGTRYGSSRLVPSDRGKDSSRSDVWGGFVGGKRLVDGDFTTALYFEPALKRWMRYFS